MTPNEDVFRFPKVKGRYVQWDEQPPPLRRAARASLWYNRTTWDRPGTAEIEARSWDDLTAAQQDAALSLGFYRRTWDCFQNHYRAYAWKELDRDGRDAAAALGWDAATWDAAGPGRDGTQPPAYDAAWDRLGDAERDAATLLCFFEDTWEGRALARATPASADAGPDGAGVGGAGVEAPRRDAPAQTSAQTSVTKVEAGSNDQNGFSLSIMADPTSLANRVMGNTAMCVLSVFGLLVPSLFAV